MLGRRLIAPQPDADWSELDGCEEVVVSLVVPGGDGTEVFKLVEEALDEVTTSVEERAERGDVLSVRHRLHAGP